VGDRVVLSVVLSVVAAVVMGRTQSVENQNVRVPMN
jgi:hypothetical protein